MSLILDALNKSEQERSERDHAVNIHAVHSVATGNGKNRRRGLWEGLAIVLLAMAFYFYTQFTGKEVAAVTEVAEPTPQRLVEKPMTQPQLQPQQPHEPVEMAEPAKAGTSVATTDAVKQLYQQTEAAATPVAEPEPAPSPTPEPAVDENAQWNAVPLISQLPPRIRGAIASIDFSVHMYSDQAGASFVHLNGDVRREGDMVAPGLRLVKIFEYGVILDYQGTQFRLLPLSGWINM